MEDKMQKFYLRVLPYIISLLTGILIFAIVDYITNPNWQNLILNISAGLISVPFIFICYELIKNISEQKIKNKIRIYITYHSKKVFFAFIKYFFTWFFPTKNKSITLTEEDTEQILSLPLASIEKMLSDKVFLGFFIYKDISEDIRSLSAIVKNNNLTEYITDTEMIHIINILRNITLIRREILDFMVVGKDKSLKIKKDDNPHNFELKLFNKNIRIDNGFFDVSSSSRLLEYFKVPTETIEILSNQIYDLISDIKTIMELMKIDFWDDSFMYENK